MTEKQSAAMGAYEVAWKSAPMISTKPRRKNLRLPGYDYAQAGFYFVTVCVHDRHCLFGDIDQGEMQLNWAGQLVTAVWLDLPNHYHHLRLDQFVVMPNHIHGILNLENADIDSDAKSVGAGFKPAPTKRHALPEIVRAFKTFSARRINETRNTAGIPVWQRNYYEHIIRNDADYLRIAEYIVNNPAKWHEDSLHPSNLAKDSITLQGGRVGAGLVRAGLKPAPTNGGMEEDDHE